MRLFPIGVALSLLAVSPAFAQPAPTVTAADLLRHVTILAGDDYQGRKPGTEGEAETLSYIAAQMQAAGLSPAGRNGWYDPVELAERRSFGHRVAWTASGRPLPFNQQDFVAVGAEPVEELRDAPVWFAGHGLRNGNIDQLAGADLKGAIVLVLMDGPEVAGFPSYAERVKTVIAAGAAAVIGILGEDTAWSTVTGNFERGQNRLGLEKVAPIQGAIPLASAERLIGDAGGDLEALLNGSTGPEFKAVRLGFRGSLEVTTRVRRYTSANLIGRLPGTASNGQNLLYLAHWDHLGICRPEAADKICNGAVDNASGIAVLLETARGLAKGPRPQRDILFLATTAEEIGLLGAAAFAADPPVPLASIVAAINIDTIGLTPAGEPVAMIGRGRTAIDALADETARELGREIDADRDADTLLQRQDGWVLAQAGVPAVMIQGAVSDMARLGAFLSSDYHKPSDQADKPIMLDGAAEDTALLIALGRKLADPHLYDPPRR